MTLEELCRRNSEIRILSGFGSPLALCNLKVDRYGLVFERIGSLIAGAGFEFERRQLALNLEVEGYALLDELSGIVMNAGFEGDWELGGNVDVSLNPKQPVVEQLRERDEFVEVIEKIGETSTSAIVSKRGDQLAIELSSPCKEELRYVIDASGLPLEEWTIYPGSVAT